jgi:hypothetical protein
VEEVEAVLEVPRLVVGDREVRQAGEVESEEDG